jgi:hypothetical protein
MAVLRSCTWKVDILVVLRISNSQELRIPRYFEVELSNICSENV